MATKPPKQYPSWTPPALITDIERLHEHIQKNRGSEEELQILIRLATTPAMEEAWREMIGAHEATGRTGPGFLPFAFRSWALETLPADTLTPKEIEGYTDEVVKSARKLHQALTMLGVSEHLINYQTPEEFHRLYTSILVHAGADEEALQAGNPYVDLSQSESLYKYFVGATDEGISPSIFPFLKRLSERGYIEKKVTARVVAKPNAKNAKVTYFIRRVHCYFSVTCESTLSHKALATIASTTFNDPTIDTERVKSALQQYTCPPSRSGLQ